MLMVAFVTITSIVRVLGALASSGGGRRAVAPPMTSKAAAVYVSAAFAASVGKDGVLLPRPPELYPQVTETKNGYSSAWLRGVLPQPWSTDAPVEPAPPLYAQGQFLLSLDESRFGNTRRKLHEQLVEVRPALAHETLERQ